ncbi:MAG: hypothetical protein UR27_C0022G0011 [Candidatus Peregrinibacteria bacterium GW2011_GWA2_33_10]|nr:MAG: hypothetical protein UR27_C0022G0011 [Candidatus Peregrinibacteria bacterium GW2011_GWA2_33_10]KKP38709.1 MAG: hypothetical protein UR30_C0016G0023 [Candidatus Peregrinibacteria bacterium GW2011_GWC2_33_13]OGJ49311.1 MAG: hypothetical protein A2229_01790 [Candidatus Peregrinibacteria bacterium RIFOXYA2_FULL_33_7]
MKIDTKIPENIIIPKHQPTSEVFGQSLSDIAEKVKIALARVFQDPRNIDPESIEIAEKMLKSENDNIMDIIPKGIFQPLKYLKVNFTNIEANTPAEILSFLALCDVKTTYAYLLQKLEENTKNEKDILEILKFFEKILIPNIIVDSIILYFNKKNKFTSEDIFTTNTLSACITALQNPNEKIRYGAYRFLIVLGPLAKPAMPELARLLQKDETNIFNRIRLIRALRAIRNEEASILIKEAMTNKNEDPEVKCEAICQLSDSYLADFLETLKTEKYIMVFESIIKRLWQILDKNPELFNGKIQDTLLEIFETQHEYYSRKKIIKFILELLKKFGNKSSLENLIVCYEKISKKIIKNDSESNELELLKDTIYQIRRRVKASLPENHKNSAGYLTIAKTGILDGAISLVRHTQEGNVSIFENNQEGNISLFEEKEK